MSSSPTTVLLVRHADVSEGRRARLNGWHDVGLTAAGERQVRALRGAFRGGPGPDAVYASPLRRALETARPIARDARLPLRIVRSAREIRCGAVDGLLASEVQLRWPEHWAANLRQDDDDFRWPGGESQAELRARAVRLLDALAARHPSQRLVVVTHAGVVATVVGVVRGVPAARWEANRPGNTGITEVRWTRGGGELVRFDDRAHLAAALTG